jgi:hypothetical protein
MISWMTKFLEKADSMNGNQSGVIFSLLNKKGQTALSVIIENHPEFLTDLFNRITVEEKYSWLRMGSCNGWTPLMAALKSKSHFINTILVGLTTEQKYDLLITKDRMDSTALLVAARYHPESVVHLLANLSSEQKYNLLLLENKNGQTPFSIAVCSNPQILIHMFDGLTSDQKMKLLTTKDKEGISPLSYLATNFPEYLNDILHQLDENHKIDSCALLFKSLLNPHDRNYYSLGTFFLDSLLTQSLLERENREDRYKLVFCLAQFKWLLRLAYRENKEKYLPTITAILQSKNYKRSLFYRVITEHREPFGFGNTRTARYFNRELASYLSKGWLRA